MKIGMTTLALLATLVFFACGDSASTQTETETATEVASTPAVSGAFAVDAGSTLGWTGSKVGKSHNGTIDITSGGISLTDGVVTGGEFVIDMNSIKDLDVENEEYNAKLVGHLKSDDFFGVEAHPTATFKITGAEAVSGQDSGNYSVTGDLTIKGITHSINFPAQIDVTAEGVSTKAVFPIDRSKWEVKFGSTNFFEDLVGDKIISNEIEIALDFVSKPAQS